MFVCGLRNEHVARQQTNEPSAWSCSEPVATLVFPSHSLKNNPTSMGAGWAPSLPQNTPFSGPTHPPPTLVGCAVYVKLNLPQPEPLRGTLMRLWWESEGQGNPLVPQTQTQTQTQTPSDANRTVYIRK